MPATARLPLCSLCNEPVEIETAKANENGDAVHEDCYVVRIRPKHTEHIAVSPMTLVCPRCAAKAGKVCGLYAGDLELVHVERIEAAVAMNLAATKN